MTFQKQIFSFITLSIIAFIPVQSMAQQVPSTVDAGRIQSDIDQQFQESPAVPPSETKKAPKIQSPAGAENIEFVLNELNITGATVISQDELKPLYNSYIGQTIALSKIYEIANEITLMYRDQGYILSRAIVPQQEIDNGVVTIQIIEGFIDGYSIEGETYGAAAHIQKYAENLVNSGVLTAKELERQLLLINDIPGIKARSVLTPSKQEVPGAAHLAIVVDHDRWEGYASVDNFGNSYLGEMRGTAHFQVNSLFNQENRLNAVYLTAPDNDELHYFSFGYQQNILDNGTTLSVDISKTLTDPSLPSNLGGNLGSQGKAKSLNLNLAHPFVRSRSFNVYGQIGLEVSQNETVYDPAFSVLNTQDNSRVLSAQVSATYLDRLAGYSTGNIKISQGLEVFGSSHGGDTGLSRAQGEPSFTKLKIEGTRFQKLYGPVNIFLGATAQWSKDPLLASQEFGVGGSNYGRGYDSSEITGDHGVAAKAELIYTKQVQKQFLDYYQLYGFYDIGSVWDKDPGAGQPVRSSIASVGVGSRFNFSDTVKGNAFVALPLINGSQSRGDESDDMRFKFSLTKQF